MLNSQAAQKVLGWKTLCHLLAVLPGSFRWLETEPFPHSQVQQQCKHFKILSMWFFQNARILLLWSQNISPRAQIPVQLDRVIKCLLHSFCWPSLSPKKSGLLLSQQEASHSSNTRLRTLPLLSPQISLWIRRRMCPYPGVHRFPSTLRCADLCLRAECPSSPRGFSFGLVLWHWQVSFEGIWNFLWSHPWLGHPRQRLWTQFLSDRTFVPRNENTKGILLFACSRGILTAGE